LKSAKALPYLFPVIIAGLLPIIFKGNEYFLHIYIVCIINIILGSSLRAMATTGQMSIGQAGFMAIGAYTSAILVTKFNFPVYGAFLMGGVAAMILAAVIGYPLARVKTIYFVMVTMFLGEIIRLFLFEWRSMTGGSTGMMGIPRIEILSAFGFSGTGWGERFEICYFGLALLIVVHLILYNIERSSLGRVFAAIGQDESVASSVGINVARHKVMIFCIGSFFTGLAGSFYAHYMTVLNPDTFGVFMSLYILIYVAVGGKKFSGPIAGAIVLTLIPEIFGGLKQYQPLVFVLVLFIVVFLIPEGLAGLPEMIRSKFRKTKG
jgi:branched-chain amino acid transport system permease protein